MENMILVTVLITLGIMSVITSIGLLFSMMKNKININTFDDNISNIHNRIEKENNIINRTIDNDKREIFISLNEKINVLYNELALLDKKIYDVDSEQKYINTELKKLMELKSKKNKELLVD